jgi:hypothetical protein
VVRKTFLALCLLAMPVVGCRAPLAVAGPVCEGGKCAVRAAKTVVTAPVRVVRKTVRAVRR